MSWAERRNSVNNHQVCLILCTERDMKLNKYQNINWPHSKTLGASRLTDLVYRVIPCSEFFIESYTHFQLRQNLRLFEQVSWTAQNTNISMRC